jgi:carbamoyltransferase
MINWGINALNHGSSLAVFSNNGKLQSLDFCKDDILSESAITSALRNGVPDKIFWYERPWVKKARQVYAGQYSTALDMSVLPRKYLKNIGVNAPITYTPHHASHAAAGYYTSPFNHCAVVVLDAIGEFESATIWNCVHGEMKKVWSRSYPDSLGLFYSAFTQFVGLTPIRDEYLLQKMAEQGDPYKFLQHVRSYFDAGVLNSNTNFHRGVLHWGLNHLETLQEQCDLAAAVQKVFEEQVSYVMLKAKELTNANSLVYMGGCAMNSTTNKKVVEPNWKYIWSLPNPGDPSSSVGAVLYRTKQRVWDFKWDPVRHIEIKI